MLTPGRPGGREAVLAVLAELQRLKRRDRRTLELADELGRLLRAAGHRDEMG